MAWLKFLLGGGFGVCVATCNAQILPALSVEPLKISDAAAYGTLVEEINAAMKTEYGVPLFLRAYESTSMTGRGDRAFSLSPSVSFEALLENHARFEDNEKFSELRGRLDILSDSSGRVFLKAVRFDGTNSPGWLLNYLVRADDEEALLLGIASELQGLGLEEKGSPMLNVFRVVAGQSQFTHLVSLNFASSIALGAGMDAIAASDFDFTYSESGDQLCEVMESVVFRELGP